MNNEKVGKFICSLRKSKNLTQQQLGDMVGVGGKSVSKWERGINMPDISIINEVSKILGVSTNELLNGEFDKKSANEEYRKRKAKKRYKIILICILTLILIVFIILLFQYKNQLYEYHLQSTNDDFLIEGNIQFDKNKYSIKIDRICCLVDECMNVAINNVQYSLSINNTLVYRYKEVDDEGKNLLFNEYLYNKGIIFEDNYIDSVITYHGLRNHLNDIVLLVEGSDINDIGFYYIINMEITDKK